VRVALLRRLSCGLLDSHGAPPEFVRAGMGLKLEAPPAHGAGAAEEAAAAQRDSDAEAPIWTPSPHVLASESDASDEDEAALAAAERDAGSSGLDSGTEYDWDADEQAAADDHAAVVVQQPKPRAAAKPPRTKRPANVALDTMQPDNDTVSRRQLMKAARR
jgi:hypothetical protein